MTVPINVNKFDPYGAMQGPARALSGVIDTGSVTYDAYFGEGVFARWVYVGTTGDLSYVKYNGVTESLPNLAAGVWHPIFAIKINSSGTSIAANQLRWGS